MTVLYRLDQLAEHAFESFRARTRQDATRRARKELAERELCRRHILDFTKRLTPFEYLAGWFHVELSEALMAFIEGVENREAPRLIIQVPPRHGKSTLCSEMLPPFILGHHPEWEVVAATYNQTLADTFGRRVRNTLNDERYQDLFPALALDPRANSASFVATTRRGSYRAVGIGGALTGAGAHVLIIDDPVKDREEADSELQRNNVWDWYSSVARTRLSPGGGIIVIQTRWHEDDLAGRLLAQAEANPEADQFMLIDYPATAIEDEPNRKAGECLHRDRYDEKELAKIRASMLPRDWSALYQQRPSPDDGDFFRKDFFLFYNRPDMPPDDELYWYVACDPAIAQKQYGDYTVIWPFAVDAHGTLWFGWDVTIARIGAHDIVDTLLDRAEQHNAMALIVEGGAITRAIEPEINRRMRERGRYFSVITPSPTKDKVLRARPLQARMEQGMARFPNSPLIHDQVVPQFLGFPNVKYDDIVDCASWAATTLDQHVLPSENIRRRHVAPNLQDVIAREDSWWTMEDIEARVPENIPARRPHAPPPFLGGARRGGAWRFD